MPNEPIETMILSHAQERKSRFAGRMSLSELPNNDLPRELRHFSVIVDGVIDYLPMNYLVTGDSFFSSLDKGDFGHILEYFQLIDSTELNATEVAHLYITLEFPSRGRAILFGVGDLDLPPEFPYEVKQQLAEIIGPPFLHKNPGLVQCAFFLLNGRQNTIEEVLIEVKEDYTVNHSVKPIVDLSGGASSQG